jgi:hypothetical protein
MGPHPFQEDLHHLYFIFASALAHLSRGPPLSLEVSATPTQPEWPYGLHNAMRTYSHLTRPAEDTSVGLPHHHLQSLSELLASTTASSNVDSEEDGGDWARADFSGLDDPRALHLDSSNYLLESLNPDDESYDPSRECFVCDGELREGVSDENEGEHTLAGPAARTVTCTRGAAMPPLVGQPQP